MFHFLRHGGTEHHHLFVGRSLSEGILNITSHLGVADNLVTLVDHEEFALNEA